MCPLVSNLLFSYLRPSLLVADKLLVLEVNHNIVPVRHRDHKTTSVRCPHHRLIWDLLVLFEELLIYVCEDADDRK